MSYDQIYRIMNLLGTKKHMGKSLKKMKVLDLGCGRGDFVEELMAKGIDAKGLDYAPRQKKPYLIEGDASNLKDTFGDETFDIITANGVLCYGGISEYLMMFDRKKFDIMQKRNYARGCHSAVLKVLESSYDQLNYPGLFINSENNYSLDSIIYTKKDARDIGFQILGHGVEGAILARNKK